MEIVWAAVLGFVIDQFLGDPRWMPHPVVYMGKCISFLERKLRAVFPRTKKGELIAGIVLVLMMTCGTAALSKVALWLLSGIPPLRFALELVWCWQALAARDLVKESMLVYDRLTLGTLEEARKAVSRIVGRDTEQLTGEGVARAAVETIAENFSDGVIAPLFFMLLGGAPLALVYKSINTMDSMVGYKNDRYLYFGRAAAKLDDAANCLPSRISTFLLMTAALLCGQDGSGAFHIWRRDRRAHASPNSAQTESVMAGALGVRLAGPASYFGVLHEKPTIGDAHRETEPEDIRRANRMMVCGSFLGLCLFCGIRMLVITIGG